MKHLLLTMMLSLGVIPAALATTQPAAMILTVSNNPTLIAKMNQALSVAIVGTTFSFACATTTVDPKKCPPGIFTLISKTTDNAGIPQFNFKPAK